MTAYALALAASVFFAGFPTERIQQVFWIMLALFLYTAGTGRSWRRTLADWIPFAALLFVYDYTRGVADTLGRPIHILEPVHADEWIFGGNLPTVWLQTRLYDPFATHWYDVLVSLIYFSHFLAAWVVAGVLYVNSRPLWASFTRRVLALSAAGLLTYMLYPASPP